MPILTTTLYFGLALSLFTAAAADTAAVSQGDGETQTESAQAEAANGAEALKTFYANVNSLRADFEQVQLGEGGEIFQESAGVFLLERPARFRWEYNQPYRQIIVSDGDTFRFYDVDLAQVTVRDVGETLRATPALLLSGGTELGAQFQIESPGEQDGLSWVKLTPRGDDSDFREIRIGFEGGLPARMELDDNLGQTTRIDFHNIETGIAMPKAGFTLDIPDDVEVVDAREGAASE